MSQVSQSSQTAFAPALTTVRRFHCVLNESRVSAKTVLSSQVAEPADNENGISRSKSTTRNLDMTKVIRSGADLAIHDRPGNMVVWISRSGQFGCERLQSVTSGSCEGRQGCNQHIPHS